MARKPKTMHAEATKQLLLGRITAEEYREVWFGEAFVQDGKFWYSQHPDHHHWTIRPLISKG